MTTGLFEAAGIILKKNEKIVMRGTLKGKVPKGVKTDISIWTGAPKLKVEWENIDGELVLTNKRLIVVGKKYGEIVLFTLELENFIAVRKNEWDELVLSMNLGTGRIENMELEVDETSEWVKAIRSQLSLE